MCYSKQCNVCKHFALNKLLGSKIPSSLKKHLRESIVYIYSKEKDLTYNSLVATSIVLNNLISAAAVVITNDVLVSLVFLIQLKYFSLFPVVAVVLFLGAFGVLLTIVLTVVSNVVVLVYVSLLLLVLLLALLMLILPFLVSLMP